MIQGAARLSTLAHPHPSRSPAAGVSRFMHSLWGLSRSGEFLSTTFPPFPFTVYFRSNSFFLDGPPEHSPDGPSSTSSSARARLASSHTTICRPAQRNTIFLLFLSLLLLDMRVFTGSRRTVGTNHSLRSWSASRWNDGSRATKSALSRFDWWTR